MSVQQFSSGTLGTGTQAGGSAASTDYRIERINRLAYPKGKIPRCELTGLPAQVMLVAHNVSLCYATEEHAEQAWHGIMHKIGPLVGPLRAAPPMIGSEEDRARRQYTVRMSKRALVDLCQQEASTFLVKGRFDLAIPGAIQALAFCKEIFGEGSIEMVPPYLLLSEANLGLGRLQAAEEFLSLANWSILKNPDCSNNIRSQLHRNFGKLYTAQNKLDEAIRELAKDIYCSSLEVGPENVNTSPGIFLMANTLYAKRNVESALAFYDKVVDIWYKFMASLRQDPQLAEALGNESQLSEGVEMLTRVLNTRLNLLGEGHIATGEARYTLGLLNSFMGNHALAVENLTAASNIYEKQLGQGHQSYKDVMAVLDQLSDQQQQQLQQGGTRSAADQQGGSTDGVGGAGASGAVGGVVNNFVLNSSRRPTPEGGEAGDHGALLSASSLLNQFPGGDSVMPRAPKQSPIPLPPLGSAAHPHSTEGTAGDAMTMSPPQSAG